MRAVISLYTESMKEVADITLQSHVNFAQDCGWDQLSKVVNQENCLWEKLNFISECLNKHYKEILWLDADVLITSHNNIVALTEESNEARIFLTADINGLNAGVMLIENDPWTKMFFHACKTHGKTLFEDRPNGEQQAIQHFSQIHPYKGIVHYVSQRCLNSYDPEEYTYPCASMGHWKKGDFAVHLPSISNERRIEIFKKYIK